MPAGGPFGWIFDKLRIQGRMQIFEKMTQKALNRIVPDFKPLDYQNWFSMSKNPCMQSMSFVDARSVELWPFYVNRPFCWIIVETRLITFDIELII